MLRLIAVALAVAFAAVIPARAEPHAVLAAQGYGFELVTPDGTRLGSTQLVGAILEMDDPAGRLVTARIDSVTPSAERPDILLHALSVLDPATHTWGPMCGADIHGRRAAFPVPGHWNGQAFVKDKAAWFLTCAAGSQGKCILWGYDPWGRGPHGEDLAAYYQACQHMVRADYSGRGDGHTRNGTSIDIWDVADIQKPESLADPTYAFEAGWGPDGAVCAARTRWTELLPLSVLLQSAPRLVAQPCDEAEARRRGALLFNRSRLAPR
jgi:hypothetical protein